jgi:hypothetical protein
LDVRNWGDELIVNHSDTAKWARMLQGIGSFRRKFLEANVQLLAKRRETAMKLEDYLVANIDEESDQEV